MSHNAGAMMTNIVKREYNYRATSAHSTSALLPHRKMRRRRRTSVERDAPFAPTGAATLAALPRDLSDELLGNLTCADVARFAQTGRVSRVAAQRAQTVCSGAWRLFASLRRDLDCYLAMMFVATARSIPYDVEQPATVLGDALVPRLYWSQDAAIVATAYDEAEIPPPRGVTRLQAPLDPSEIARGDADDDTEMRTLDINAPLVRDQMNQGLAFTYDAIARYTQSRGGEQNVALTTYWQAFAIGATFAVGRRPISDLLSVLHATDFGERFTNREWNTRAARDRLASYLLELLCDQNDTHAPFELQWIQWDDYEPDPEPVYDAQMVAALTPTRWDARQVANRLRRALAQALRLASTANASDPASQTPAGAPLRADEWTSLDDDGSATLAAFAGGGGDVTRFDWIDDAVSRLQTMCNILPRDVVVRLISQPRQVATAVSVGELTTLMRRINSAAAPAVTERECRW